MNPSVEARKYLVTGATDARYYQPLSPNVYRFLPVPFRKEDLERAHGVDERIAVDDYLDAIRFYQLLMKNIAG